MKVLQRFTIALFILVSVNVSAQVSTETKMKTFIDGLMKKMTLEEKIGQLNLPGSGDIVTGQAGSSDIAKKIEQGKVGGGRDFVCRTPSATAQCTARAR